MLEQPLWGRVRQDVDFSTSKRHNGSHRERLHCNLTSVLTVDHVKLDEVRVSAT